MQHLNRKNMEAPIGGICFKLYNNMKKEDAQIKVYIDVECPYCEETVDLLQITHLTDDGYIYGRALGNVQWGCESFDEKVECPDCKKDFIVQNINW